MSLLSNICQMIVPSLIRLVFRVQPDKPEFQGKLTTPGNCVLRRCSFSSSGELCPPPRNMVAGEEWQKSQIKSRSLYNRSLRLSPLGDSLKTFLFWDSARTYSKLYTSLLRHGKGILTTVILLDTNSWDLLSNLNSVLCAAAAWQPGIFGVLQLGLVITRWLHQHSQEIHSVMLLRLIRSAMLYLFIFFYNEWA